MRLTLQTDYSLRVLMYLSVSRDRLATIKEISECYGISKNHLMKVVYQLGLHGYVETIRGKGGGLRLGREPDSFTIGDLVRATEPDMALVGCFAEGKDCRVEPGCKLKGVMADALTAFLAVLDEYTLADIVSNPKGISQLLGLETVA